MKLIKIRKKKCVRMLSHDLADLEKNLKRANEAEQDTGNGNMLGSYNMSV